MKTQIIRLKLLMYIKMRFIAKSVVVILTTIASTHGRSLMVFPMMAVKTCRIQTYTTYLSQIVATIQVGITNLMQTVLVHLAQ